MVKYLADSTVFETCDKTWSQIVSEAKEFNLKWGFKTGTGVVYNYGIWKPTKSKFRYIAGTRANADLDQEERRKQVGPPRQPLFFAHKTLVRLLQHVEEALKEKDKERMSNEGIKAFWGIDSISAFTRLARSHADEVVRNGQFTADFCTMYTSFPFTSMISRTLEAVKEAWEYRAKEAPMPIDGSTHSSELRLGTTGWSWEGIGFTVDQVAEFLSKQLHVQRRCDQEANHGDANGNDGRSPDREPCMLHR